MIGSPPIRSNYNNFTNMTLNGANLFELRRIWSKEQLHCSPGAWFFYKLNPILLRYANQQLNSFAFSMRFILTTDCPNNNVTSKICFCNGKNGGKKRVRNLNGSRNAVTAAPTAVDLRDSIALKWLFVMHKSNNCENEHFIKNLFPFNLAHIRSACNNYLHGRFGNALMLENT